MYSYGGADAYYKTISESVENAYKDYNTYSYGKLDHSSSITMSEIPYAETAYNEGVMSYFIFSVEYE